MNTQTRLLPAMRELNVSNHLLGDQKALAAAWERDGYWFFRDVLDKDVIAGIRKVYLDYLNELGVTDPEDPGLYNGADLTNLPVNSNVNKLNERKVHTLLHEAPTINAFFRQLFGCEPFWVPFTVHRTNPPVTDPAKPRLDFIHEDGIYNDGLDFMICWVPLDDIPEEVGGIAVVEGVHNGRCLHSREGRAINPIRLEDVPDGSWRRSDYRPGDVLLMSLRTPHSGISNVSADRFRLSMDTRIMPARGRLPIIGRVVEVSSQSVTVAVDGGGERSLRFDDDSFVRGKQGNQLRFGEIPESYRTGEELIVTADGDLVINMRPQT